MPRASPAGRLVWAKADDVAAAALKMGYSKDEVDTIPEGANFGLGCGAPLHAAGVAPGDTVLDLGSGAGFDAFLVARAVGAGQLTIDADRWVGDSGGPRGMSGSMAAL